MRQKSFLVRGVCRPLGAEPSPEEHVCPQLVSQLKFFCIFINIAILNTECVRKRKTFVPNNLHSIFGNTSLVHSVRIIRLRYIIPRNFHPRHVRHRNFCHRNIRPRNIRFLASCPRNFRLELFYPRICSRKFSSRNIHPHNHTWFHPFPSDRQTTFPTTSNFGATPPPYPQKNGSK